MFLCPSSPDTVFFATHCFRSIPQQHPNDLRAFGFASPSGMSRCVDCWVVTGAARKRIGPFLKTPESGTALPRNIPEERGTQLHDLRVFSRFMAISAAFESRRNINSCVVHRNFTV